MRLARFGDNMRNVAVTEGDKVEAELRWGVSVNTYGVNELVEVVDAAADKEIDVLVEEYADALRRGGRAPARAGTGTTRCATARVIELGMRAFLVRRRLHGVHHELRGPRRSASAARSRRTAADGRRLRLRRRGRLEDLGHAAHAQGGRRRAAGRHVLHGGLHLPPGPRRGADPRGAHARGLPLDRGREAVPGDPPARHRRPRGPGPAWSSTPPPATRSSSAPPTSATASGSSPTRPRSWRRASRCRTSRSPGPCGGPAPDLQTSTESWLTAGGPHHTVLSTALDADHLVDLADMVGTELVLIDGDTTVRRFRQELRWNQAYHRLAQGF